MAQLTTFTKGALVRLAVNIQVSGVDTDPTVLTFKWIDPAGNEADDLVFDTDAALVRDSVGDFHVDKTLSASGVYQYKWIGTGAAAGAKTRKIFSETDNF